MVKCLLFATHSQPPNLEGTHLLESEVNYRLGINNDLNRIKTLRCV